MSKSTRKLWTEDELAVLKKMYPHSPNIEIAAVLKRPKSSIPSVALKLGLTRPTNFKRAPPGRSQYSACIDRMEEEPKDENLELWKVVQKNRAFTRNYSNKLSCIHADRALVYSSQPVPII